MTKKQSMIIANGRILKTHLKNPNLLSHMYITGSIKMKK